MKKISTDQIVDPGTLQPFTGRSLEFLQDARDENDAAMIKAMITSNLGSYSLTVPYVISGCVVSDSGKDVTAGEVFFGGKFYEVVAVNGATNIAQFVLTKTQDATADPLEFSDTTNKNVHDIYKYVGTDTATPGDFDSSDLTSMYGAGKLTSDIQTSTQTTTSTSFIDLSSMSYTTPNDGLTRTWLIIAKSDITTSASGGDGGRIRIYNNTTSTQLAIASSYLDVTAATIAAVTINTGCQKVVSLAPNTVIKLQVLSIAGGSMTFEDNSFVMVEL